MAKVRGIQSRIRKRELFIIKRGKRKLELRIYIR